MDIFIAIFLVVCSTLLTLAVQSRGKNVARKNKDVKTKFSKKVLKSSSLLSKHSQEFNKKEILKISGNIYVAIGYGLANCIMIEGTDGVIIIDTLESCEVAREVKAEFEKITTKPVVGIILTHFHADHASGTEVFTEGVEEVPIYAHDSFPKYFSQVMDVRSQITFKRAVRQFGTEIPEEVKENAGIGISLRLDGSTTTSYIFPTKTFSDKLIVELAGIELELIHAPGETNDQIIAFPNLYAIRGTMHRDTLQWVEALDLMIQLEPDILVPQHTRPLHGRSEVLQTITAYRDAIQFVHDQTVRFMNKGFNGNEIAQIVKLPPHLINHPYLIEYYGTVEWSVKAVYHGYMGWFSGRPADLHPLPRIEEASLYLDLAGGVYRVLEAGEKALKDDNAQWALQLADLVLDAGQAEPEDIKSAKKIRSRALLILSTREISAPGMNWYLTEDMVMQGLDIIPSKKSKAQRIKRGSVLSLFQMLTCMLDSSATEQVNLNTGFNFTDSGKRIYVCIRRGIALVKEGSITDGEENVDIKVTTTENTWKEIMAKEKSAVSAAMTGLIKVEPGIQQLGVFFSYFDING
ncbi:uncharacterized protein LOC111716758 isoform X2 [Eurytemora carolleeae]|uniref:uncharacterized protein LOC111716758 isoform X2 n=1 Tax=Eurytemora carolleeae TaxID=1294199 RepID=UPI000C75A4FB|nr:uncharacterized protein LOC111716758 isoform X2 [Eurytemora carolleeae]|eukprot:XP_023348024.1 uncharacterized protein LOC111716758 isoform X2 [Eurytemora affinis]